MSYEAILAALRVENASRCAPPLPENEVADIAKSVSRYEPQDKHVESREDRFPHVWLDDCKLDLTANDYVKGLIGPGSFTVIYGPPGDGKTFLTIDMMNCIASGQSWRGRKVRQGLCVYVAAEAGASIVRRFVAWRDSNLSESREGRIPMAVVTRGANL